MPDDALSPAQDQSDPGTHFPVSIMKTVTDVRMMTVKASNKDQDKALEERERESGIRQWHPQLPGSLPTPAEQERDRYLGPQGLSGRTRNTVMCLPAFVSDPPHFQDDVCAFQLISTEQLLQA